MMMVANGWISVLVRRVVAARAAVANGTLAPAAYRKSSAATAASPQGGEKQQAPHLTYDNRPPPSKWGNCCTIC